MTQSENTSWVLPDFHMVIEHGPGREQSDFDLRKRLVTSLVEIAENEGWTKAEASRRLGVAEGSLSQWYSGKYQGRFDGINSKVSNWLDNYAEASRVAAQIPMSPDFIKTEISNEIVNLLTSAQLMPGMVMVNCEAGLGKTISARYYASTRPNVYVATVSPHTKTVHGCLVEIGEAIGIAQRNPSAIVRSIGNRIKRSGGGSLLIVDESQNLVDDAINQLRHFLDNYDCGVALLGNSENYSRFSGWHETEKYGQLRRRIFKRVHVTKPKKSDLVKFIRAWGITDKDQTEFLTGVGMKPGAFGQIDMTVKLAKILAAGASRELELGDLKAAWANRDVEVM